MHTFPFQCALYLVGRIPKLSDITDSAAAWLATKWVLTPEGYAFSMQNAYYTEFYWSCHIRSTTDLFWLLNRVLVSVCFVNFFGSPWFTFLPLFFFITALHVRLLSSLQRLRQDVTTDRVTWLCDWMEPGIPSSHSLGTCRIGHSTSNNWQLLPIPPLKIWNKHLRSVELAWSYMQGTIRHSDYFSCAFPAHQHPV